MESPAHIALVEVGNQEWNRKNLAIEEFDTKLEKIVEFEILE